MKITGDLGQVSFDSRGQKPLLEVKFKTEQERRS